MSKFLDSTGVSHLISIIKGAFVAKVAGKGLSTNDYSATDKAKVDAIPENPKYTDTDTTVTAVGNHYVPSTTSNTTKSASGGTVASVGTEVQVVTGVTIDAAGHVTGVTSAGVKNTNLSDAQISAMGYTKNAGTVTGVMVGTTSYSQTDGVVTLPAYPTTLPASDVPSWAKASSKPSYTASEVGAIPATEKGVANGVAALGSDGKVPSSQLPSYVDDVIEGYYKAADGKFYATKSGSTYSNVITGETGKIYVDLDTNKSYRYGGTAYAEISSSDVIGIKVGSSGSTINPSGGIITIPAYEAGAQAHKAPTAAEVKAALGTGSGTTKFLREDGTFATPAYIANTDRYVNSAAFASQGTNGASGVKMTLTRAGSDTTQVTGNIPVVTTSAAGVMTGDMLTKLNGIATGATSVSKTTVSGWGFVEGTALTNSEIDDLWDAV